MSRARQIDRPEVLSARLKFERTAHVQCSYFVTEESRKNAAQERLQAAFTAATEALTVFRNKHIQIVTRYIILPARSGRKDGPQNLASSSSKKNGEELTGTGGTTLVPFLKQSRDETSEAGRLE